MILTLSLISWDPVFCPRFLVTVPRIPTANDITTIFIFLILFNTQAKSTYLLIFSLSFIDTLLSTGTTKSTWWQVLFFLLIKTRCVIQVKIGWSICISIPREFYASQFLGEILFYEYTIWKPSQKFVFCTIPSRSSVMLNLEFFWASLLHSLIWLTVLYLSPRNLHFLFYCVESIFAILVRMVLIE